MSLGAGAPRARDNATSALLRHRPLVDNLKRDPAPLGALLDEMPERDCVNGAAGGQRDVASLAVFLRRNDQG